MKKFGGLSARGLVGVFIGVMVAVIILFQFAKAAPVPQIFNTIELPLSTSQTIKQAEKEYLEIQEKDKEALKTFLVDPNNYAIVSTADPRRALELYRLDMKGQTLAGSAMVPLKGTYPRIFKRIYKIYYIMD